MAEYPEHEKLKAIRDKSQVIGEFLEWAGEQGWHLAEWDPSRKWDDRMMPVSLKVEQILARYFEIDLDIIEIEKRAILDHIRSQPYA